MKQETSQQMISSMPNASNKIHPEIAIQNKIKQIESEPSMRSSTTNNNKYKIPDVIHQEIKKLAQGNHQSPNIRPSNKFMKVASKISQSKNLENRYNRVDCEICELSVPAKSLLSIGSCEHKYCNSCLHQYILYKINTFQAVECPHQNCNQTLLQTSTAYASLPLDIRKKFKKIQQYNQLLKNPNKRLCPNQNCEGYLQMPPEQEGVIRIANPTCNQCHKKFCTKCSFQEHSGECSDSQLQFFHDTLHYRQCQRCKKIIEKITGCNHITCPCGYQFCYICGGKWRHSHLCNNPNGEPIANPVECQCMCFECQCQCCQCLDDCCYDCGQACEQCCCEGCLGPCCDWCGQNICVCCEEDQCCQCCQCLRQNPGCSKFLQVMCGIVWVVFGIPIYLIFIVMTTIVKFIGGIMIGLFVIPCQVCSGQHQQFEQLEIWQILIMILLLPLTLLLFMGLGIKTTFCSDVDDQTNNSIYCCFCETFSSIWEDD